MKDCEHIKKILVVEDSELLHKMYDLIFMRHRNIGTLILHAFNGQEGLSKLNEHPDTDIIILDINMPVMSGLEFLQSCKRQRAFQKIPVIIITTEGKKEDTVRGLEAGARAYLTKPFDGAALYRLIDKIFASTGKQQGSKALAPNA